MGTEGEGRTETTSTCLETLLREKEGRDPATRVESEWVTTTVVVGELGSQEGVSKTGGVQREWGGNDSEGVERP